MHLLPSYANVFASPPSTDLTALENEIATDIAEFRQLEVDLSVESIGSVMEYVVKGTLRLIELARKLIVKILSYTMQMLRVVVYMELNKINSGVFAAKGRLIKVNAPYYAEVIEFHQRTTANIQRLFEVYRAAVAALGGGKEEIVRFFNALPEEVQFDLSFRSNNANHELGTIHAWKKYADVGKSMTVLVLGKNDWEGVPYLSKDHYNLRSVWDLGYRDLGIVYDRLRDINAMRAWAAKYDKEFKVSSATAQVAKITEMLTPDDVDYVYIISKFADYMHFLTKSASPVFTAYSFARQRYAVELLDRFIDESSTLLPQPEGQPE